MGDYNKIFSDQGIEELRQRLGISDQVEDESDEFFLSEDLFDEEDVVEIIESDSPEYVPQEGIGFPLNITVPDSLVKYRVGPDGSTVADVIVQFDEVAGATDYLVQYVSIT